MPITMKFSLERFELRVSSVNYFRYRGGTLAVTRSRDCPTYNLNQATEMRHMRCASATGVCELVAECDVNKAR